MKFKKGEIYEYELRSGTRTKTGLALIISDNLTPADRFVNLIVLSDTRPKHDYLMIGAAANTVAEIVCKGKAMYADCRIISYGDITRFGEKIADAYPEDVRELDRCICHSLGLSLKIEPEEPKQKKRLSNQSGGCPRRGNGGIPGRCGRIGGTVFGIFRKSPARAVWG